MSKDVNNIRDVSNSRDSSSNSEASKNWNTSNKIFEWIKFHHNQARNLVEMTKKLTMCDGAGCRCCGLNCRSSGYQEKVVIPLDC
jgi:hypothetical protein